MILHLFYNFLKLELINKQCYLLCFKTTAKYLLPFNGILMEMKISVSLMQTATVLPPRHMPLSILNSVLVNQELSSGQ